MYFYLNLFQRLIKLNIHISCCCVYIYLRRIPMLLTYAQCRNLFGTDYKIKNLLKSEQLFKVQEGIYSTSNYSSIYEIISLKYPDAIFTMDSAFYIHGLTDEIPDIYYLATRRESTRIKDERIRQSFLKDNIFELGKTEMDFQGDKIKIYNQERMLIELIRNKSKIAFDLYKEIIGNYRKRVNKIDFGKVSEYVEHFKMNQTIMNTIQMEVL